MKCVPAFMKGNYPASDEIDIARSVQSVGVGASPSRGSPSQVSLSGCSLQRRQLVISGCVKRQVRRAGIPGFPPRRRRQDDAVAKRADRAQVW